MFWYSLRPKILRVGGMEGVSILAFPSVGWSINIWEGTHSHLLVGSENHGIQKPNEKTPFLLDLDIITAVYAILWTTHLFAMSQCILLAPPFSEPYLQRLRKWIRMIELNSRLKEQVLMKHHYSIMINWWKLHLLSNASLNNAYEN